MNGPAGLLLCALLLVVGAAALGVSLKGQTAGSTDAAPVNIEARGRTASLAPDNDEPPQPITNAVKSSAATPSLPPLSPTPPNDQPVEAQRPATPAAENGPTPNLPRPDIEVAKVTAGTGVAIDRPDVKTTADKLKESEGVEPPGQNRNRDMAGALSVTCQTTGPAGDGHWAWRLIDGRKCWYKGAAGMNKSLLHWPPLEHVPELQ